MYQIDFADGRTEMHDSYEDCLASIERVYPDCAAGHDGDLADGGDRTLVWSSEDDAENDDGRRAIATIRRAN